MSETEYAFKLLLQPITYLGFLKEFVTVFIYITTFTFEYFIIYNIIINKERATQPSCGAPSADQVQRGNFSCNFSLDKGC